MRVETSVSLFPAAFPVPRTVPGTYTMLRKHKHSPFLCRAQDGWRALLPGRAPGPAGDVYTGLEQSNYMTF